MTPQPKDQPVDEHIDDVLLDLVIMTQTDEYPGEREDRLKQASQDIMQLCQAECNRARISELERVIRGYHSVNHLMDERELKERIAELQQLTKEEQS